jgi:hypothetical protein
MDIEVMDLRPTDRESRLQKIIETNKLDSSISHDITFELRKMKSNEK